MKRNVWTLYFVLSAVALVVALVFLVNAIREVRYVDSTSLIHPESRIAQNLDREHEQAEARRFAAAEERARRAELRVAALSEEVVQLQPEPEPEPVPEPVIEPEPEPEPEAPRAMYYAPCDPDLHPLEGWNDQPKKNRPGRIHTNLRYRRVSGRKPCALEVGKYQTPLGDLVIGPNPEGRKKTRRYDGELGTLMVH